MEPVELSWYTDYTMAWKTYKPIPSRERQIFFISKMFKLALGPTKPLSMDMGHYCPGGKSPGV
jgi:hypothetical protein